MAGKSVDSNSATAMPDGPTAQRLLHECERSARYHAARRSFLDRCHRAMMTAVLLSGSAAVAGLSENLRVEDIYLIAVMLVPTSVGALSLVWNIPGRINDHRCVMSTYYRIAAEIRVRPANKADLEKWELEISQALMDEPPTICHALNAACHNDATLQVYGENRPMYRLKRHHRLLSNWWPFSPDSFEKVDP